MPLSRLPLTDFTKIAEGIERPEDVVVSRDGRVFASVHQATVAEILPDGTFKNLGPKRGAPNGINIDHRGIIVANFGIYDGEVGPLEAFNLETGARDILLAAVESRTLTASNYPLIDSAGNIWCANSTSAASWPEALDGRADGFIYVLRPDGSSSIVPDALKFPNGLAISSDERTLFCCQTTAADVLRFSILPGARLGKGERYGPRLGLIPPFAPNPKLRLPGFITRFLGYTDGCGMDAEGNVWVDSARRAQDRRNHARGSDDYPCSSSKRETALPADQCRLGRARHVRSLHWLTERTLRSERQEPGARFEACCIRDDHPLCSRGFRSRYSVVP